MPLDPVKLAKVSLLRDWPRALLIAESQSRRCMPACRRSSASQSLDAVFTMVSCIAVRSLAARWRAVGCGWQRRSGRRARGWLPLSYSATQRSTSRCERTATRLPPHPFPVTVSQLSSRLARTAAAICDTNRPRPRREWPRAVRTQPYPLTVQNSPLPARLLSPKPKAECDWGSASRPSTCRSSRRPVNWRRPAPGSGRRVAIDPHPASTPAPARNVKPAAACRLSWVPHCQCRPFPCLAPGCWHADSSVRAERRRRLRGRSGSALGMAMPSSFRRRGCPRAECASALRAAAAAPGSLALSCSTSWHPGSLVRLECAGSVLYSRDTLPRRVVPGGAASTATPSRPRWRSTPRPAAPPPSRPCRT